MKLNNVHWTQLWPASHNRGNAPRPFIYPAREWATCLFITSIVAVGLFGYAGLDFKSQLQDNDAIVVSTERVTRYDPDEAKEIIRYYEGRTRVFSSFIENKPASVPEPIPEVAG
jgi:hypothetical protein